VVAVATSVHLPVSTSHPDAQAAIDRGLFLYYAYNGGASAKAFAQAAALDNHLAMAYWGSALASGPDLNTAMTDERFNRGARAIARAVPLEVGLPERERRFVDAMAQRFRGSFADWNRDDAAYRDAMLTLARDSHDENAELLAAEALLEHGGLTWVGASLANPSSREALTLVNSVLQRDPTNPMANHLCVHLYDLAGDRSPALPCARRLDATSFPPQAEHLAHMPAHYWVETGNYAAALASSERAYALLIQMTATSGGDEHARHYTEHDVAVGYSAAMMLGNYATAQRWAQRMGSAADSSFDALTALRFGRYAAAFNSSGDEYGGQSVRGLAALHLQRLAEARAIAARVRAGSTNQGYLPQLFLAAMADADGKPDEAVSRIRRALENQQREYSGELIPLIPAGEELGALELRRGDASAAIAAFNDVLKVYPNDPRALYGLAAALEQDGQAARAAAARARLTMEWKGADTSVNDALL
jgi:hypothetical protein